MTTEHSLAISMAPAPLEKLVALRPEAAAMIGVSIRTLDKLISLKEIRAIKIGKSVRIPIEALRSFIKKSHATN